MDMCIAAYPPEQKKNFRRAPRIPPSPSKTSYPSQIAPASPLTVCPDFLHREEKSGLLPVSQILAGVGTARNAYPASRIVPPCGYPSTYRYSTIFLDELEKIGMGVSSEIPVAAPIAGVSARGPGGSHCLSSPRPLSSLAPLDRTSQSFSPSPSMLACSSH